MLFFVVIIFDNFVLIDNGQLVKIDYSLTVFVKINRLIEIFRNAELLVFSFFRFFNVFNCFFLFFVEIFDFFRFFNKFFAGFVNVNFFNKIFYAFFFDRFFNVFNVFFNVFNNFLFYVFFSFDQKRFGFFKLALKIIDFICLLFGSAF